jgi:hypothetical protein
MMGIGVVAALSLALLAPAQGDDVLSARDAAGLAYQKSLVAHVVANGSPRERALFSRVDARGQAAADLRAVAQSAPSDALVQMVWTASGGDVRAWSNAEAGNGLAWVPLLDEQAPAVETDALIDRIAAADGYDDHFVDAWLVYRGAIGRQPMPQAMLRTPGTGSAQTARDIMAMAYAAALPMSRGMVALRHLCDRAKHPDLAAARFDACARIGRAVRDSEAAVYTQRIAASIVRVSGLESDADRDATRRLDWLLDASGKVLSEEKTADIAAYFEDLASTGSETRAQELVLSRHGLPIQPPAEWKQR